MSTDILQAARSYYGLADTECCTTQLYTNQAGQPCVSFEIWLGNDDFVAIAQRMQNMQQPDTHPDAAIIEGPRIEAMREAYNALSKAEKGRYGSFARYMGWTSDGIVEAKLPDPYATKPEQPLEKIEQLLARAKTTEFEGISQSSGNSGELKNKHVLEDIEKLPARQVVHVDAPEQPEPVSMKAVWLDKIDCTHAQTQHASDWDGGSMRYLVQWAMLTDEQKQKAKEKT